MSQPSIYGKWPTPENPNMFKINSFWIEHDSSLTTIERQTYSFLDWLGDVGGLLDGLKLFASFLVAPIAAFSMRAELLSAAFPDNKS